MKSTRASRKDRYHHGDLRNALVDTALRLVAERGPEGFSLREAARAIGVSASAVYRHFADKSALLGALWADGHAHLAVAMERALSRTRGEAGSAPRAVGSLFAISAAYVEFAMAHPAHFQVMSGPKAEGDELANLRARGRTTYQILVDVLDGLVAAGAIPAAARVGAELPVWSLVNGLASILVEGALELSARERADAVRHSVRLLLLGIGCPPRLLPDARPVTADPRER